MERISRDEYYIRIALTTAKRSTCDRAEVGAIAVKDRRIIATGYNGAPAGWKHCEDVGHKLVAKHCIRTIHAEMNIVCQCAKFGVSLQDATIYVTHRPCYHCLKHLENIGVKEVKYLHYKEDKDLGKDILYMRIIVSQLKIKNDRSKETKKL